MEKTKRWITGALIFERKEKQLKVTHYGLGVKETFSTKPEAVEYIEKCLIRALQETSFNLRDLLRKDPDKLQLVFKFYVTSEIN